MFFHLPLRIPFTIFAEKSGPTVRDSAVTPAKTRGIRRGRAGNRADGQRGVSRLAHREVPYTGRDRTATRRSRGRRNVGRRGMPCYNSNRRMTEMKKYVLDLTLTSNERLREGYALLKCTQERPLPEMRPGQFAELKVNGSETTFLRRPISINYVDEGKNEVWFLVHEVGEGTRSLGAMKAGDRLNAVMPLGNGFTLPVSGGERVLLVGGGIGAAPLLYLGKEVAKLGCRPVFLLGGRSGRDLVQLDMFGALGEVHLTTEDASRGEKGFVTRHSVLRREAFDRIAACGPRPMMAAVARYAKSKGIPCEVSLENMMACGVGACLCCVEDTAEGRLRVCKDGPVFNTDRLSWQI